MSCFLEFSYLKSTETVKSSIVTLCMTFERILKDFKVSYLAEIQVLPITFAQVPTISQLYFFHQFGTQIMQLQCSGVIWHA